MANASDRKAAMAENLRDIGLDDESIAKCLRMVESGPYQAIDQFLKNQENIHQSKTLQQREHTICKYP